VSPTPPSGCQAQDVNISKIKYDDANKVNNNAIKYIIHERYFWVL
jgi:hypothetical protein